LSPRLGKPGGWQIKTQGDARRQTVSMTDLSVCRRASA
jgi:hypothetical protein